MTQTNNPTWFAFTAWCTDLRLRVTSTNCQQSQGYIGFQLAIYTDCSFTDQVACNADINDCNTNDKILNLTGLNIGSIYYFMVDGCLGSYCTVTIDILGVCGQEQIDPWTQPVIGNLDPCVGTETYSVEDLNGARIYHWYIDGVLQEETTSRNFDVTWTTPGTYQLCVDVSNDPCVEESDPPIPLCTTITVHQADIGTYNWSADTLCVGDTIYVTSYGYSPGPYFTQMLFFHDYFGTILDTIMGDSGYFVSPIPGEFYVGAFNFITGSPLPLIGENIILDFDCLDGCCQAGGHAIYYEEIKVEVSEIICDDNGTGNDSTDDVFTFNVLVSGLSPGAHWKSTDGTIEGVAGTPQRCGPYPISGGTIMLNIYDADLSICETAISIDPPLSCSSCPETMDAGTGSLLNCIDTSAVLTGNSSATGIYHWIGPNSFSSDSLICTVIDSGWYQLSIDFGKQCISFDSVYVMLDAETPIADAGEDEELDCNHTAVLLDASGSIGNNLLFQWSNTSGQTLSLQSLLSVEVEGIYLLQLTNSSTGCSSFDSVWVINSQNELGVIALNITDENCLGYEDGVIEVTNISSGLPPYSYSLNGMTPGTDGLFDHLTPGAYQLHIEDVNGCGLDTFLIINPGIDLTLTLPEVIKVIEEQSVFITALVNVPVGNLSSIEWTPKGILACDTCLSTTISAIGNQTLQLTVVHINGCRATAEIQIIVVPTPRIFIPNTFSPNGDGYNDFFTLFANSGVESILEFTIYDRWGELLYQAHDFKPNLPESGWDGKFHEKEMPSGTFAYTIKVSLGDGTTKLFTGDVTVVR